MNYVSVNSVGVFYSSDVIFKIRPGKTVLVTLMLANNKSGAIQTVSKVAARWWEFQVTFHTDSAQVVGEVPVDLIGAFV